MIKIEPGVEFSTTYDGVTIKVSSQKDRESISLFSAKTNGTVTGKSVQTLKQIASAARVRSAMNANYFVMATGQGLGVRCGVDEWSVPRQGAWYYYAQMVGGKTEIGMDTGFWWTNAECLWACSPAMIMIRNGQIVNYTSPSAVGSKDTPTRQSMLIRTNERFAFAATEGNLSPEQCRQWALTIEGIQDLCLMDSGGSTGLYLDGKMIVPSERPITDCLAFYGLEEESDAKVMNGIDISNWQAGIDLTKIQFDFVIAKATEGTNFVDKYCDSFIQTAKKMGKPYGFYHFARPSNNAVAEAQFFVKNTLNYFGEGIPVLDWEAENKNDVQWALTWLNTVYNMTGVKPMIYMSESVVNTYDWSPVVAGDYGLWVAKYRDYNADYNYDMSTAGTAPKVKWWKGYAMWQWTSVGRLNGYNASLDCDIFYGNLSAWKAYASSHPVEETPVPADTVKELQEQIKSLQSDVAKLKDRLSRITEICKEG